MYYRFMQVMAIASVLPMLLSLFAVGYTIANRDVAEPELPITTKPRVIHTSIPEQYLNTELLLTNFHKDLISLDEVIQILILHQSAGTFVPFFDADTYYDKYYIHKQTYTQRQSK